MKKWVIPGIIVLSVLMLSLAQLNLVNHTKYDNNNQAVQSLTTQNKPSSKPQRITLESAMSKSLTPGRIYYIPDSSVVAKDTDSFSLLINVAINKDVQGLDSLIRQGKIYAIDGTTKIKYYFDVSGDYFGVDRKASKITIESGRHIGKEGYIFTDLIQK